MPMTPVPGSTRRLVGLTHHDGDPIVVLDLLELLGLGLGEGSAQAGRTFGEIAPDWERMAPYVEKAMSRVPVSAELGVKKFFCGPESFTPGPPPEFRAASRRVIPCWWASLAICAARS